MYHSGGNVLRMVLPYRERFRMAAAGAILLKPLVVTLLGRQAPDSAAGSNSATGVK